MIFDTLQKYSSIVKKYEISKFKTFGSSYEIIIKIVFTNKSVLFARDYLFTDGSRCYSYHWQNKKNECILRWDNAPHHPKTKTFPHHKHIGKKEKVEDSLAMTLEKALKFIDGKLRF
jgi:hypothetical protein